MVDTRFPVSVHIMALLAYRPRTSVSSTELAKSLRTNPTFVRRLVSRLVESGLVESTRGRGGGLKLACEPKDITLRDIYAAAVHDKQLVCLPQKAPRKSCPVSCSMSNVLLQIVGGIENSTLRYLSGTTLDHILKSVTVGGR